MSQSASGIQQLHSATGLVEDTFQINLTMDSRIGNLALRKYACSKPQKMLRTFQVAICLLELE